MPNLRLRPRMWERPLGGHFSAKITHKNVGYLIFINCESLEMCQLQNSQNMYILYSHTTLETNTCFRFRLILIVSNEITVVFFPYCVHFLYPIHRFKINDFQFEMWKVQQKI